MKTDFIPLDWHKACQKSILTNHRRGSVMVLTGREGAGKSRFLRSLRKNPELSARFAVVRCAPCGSVRENLITVAEAFNVRDFTANAPWDPLRIAKDIVNSLPAHATLAVNDWHEGSEAFRKSILFIRRQAMEVEKSLGLVLATNKLPSSVIDLGMDRELISEVYSIPEMSADEMLACMLKIASVQARSLFDGVVAKDKKSMALANHLLSRNLGWISRIEEFCAIAGEDEFAKKPFIQCAEGVLLAMKNSCRRMQRFTHDADAEHVEKKAEQQVMAFSN